MLHVRFECPRGGAADVADGSQRKQSPVDSKQCCWHRQVANERKVVGDGRKSEMELELKWRVDESWHTPHRCSLVDKRTPHVRLSGTHNKKANLLLIPESKEVGFLE